MTYVVITVAGVSSRFNQNVESPDLKCIFYNHNSKSTLLYSALKKCEGCQGVIIVGGYQFSKLKEYVDCRKEEFPFDIEVIYNPHYETYGSGYSLKLGLQECLKRKECTDIIFIEGDLLFDQQSLKAMLDGRKNYLTVNSDPICSRKAVAVYFNEKEEIKYIYDTKHGLFHIKEPFSIIYNSGQAWKFSERVFVERLMDDMRDEEWFGTNLEFIEKYFNMVQRDTIEIIEFQKWINCNTRADYLECEKYL